MYTQKTQNVQKANKTNLREIVDTPRNEKSNDNLWDCRQKSIKKKKNLQNELKNTNFNPKKCV